MRHRHKQSMVSDIIHVSTRLLTQDMMIFRCQLWTYLDAAMDRDAIHS